MLSGVQDTDDMAPRVILRMCVILGRGQGLYLYRPWAGVAVVQLKPPARLNFKSLLNIRPLVAKEEWKEFISG